MFQFVKHSFLATIPAMLFLLNSCEEKKEDPSPTPAGPVYGDTIATKSGKGFSQLVILSATSAGSGVGGGAFDDFKMVDMSLLPDGKSLQLATVSTLNTQQDPLKTLERSALDIDTKLALTASSSNLGALGYASFETNFTNFYNRSFGYQRGTNKFFKTSYTTSNFGITTGTVSGDFTYNRSATFATQPRVTDLGEIVEDLITQTTPRNDGKSNNQIFFNYQKANKSSANFYHQRIVSPDQVKNLVILGGQVEASKINDDKVLVFCHSKTTLFVAEAPIAGDNSQLNFIDSLPLPGEWSNTAISTRRSDDGSGFGVVVGQNETDKSLSLMSVRYNMATKKMTKNIVNLSIPEFGLGKINYDIDDQGNMYFDHWANNFKSDSTISIYKASGSAFSLVGQDDILKSGSIHNVRYLGGKVYAAVAYTYTVSAGGASSKKFRMAVLKED